MKASVTILPAQHFYHYCKPLKIVEAAKAKPSDESYLVVVVDLYSYKDNNQCNLLLLSSSSSPHSSSSSSKSQYICAHKASPLLDSCTSTRNTSFIDLPTNLDTSPSLHQITRLESPLLVLYSSTKRSNKVERFFRSIIALQFSRKRFSKSLSSHQISLPLPHSSPSPSSSLLTSTYCLYKGKSDSIEVDKSANLLLACYSLLHSLEPHPTSTTSYYYHYCNYFTLKYIIDCYTLLPLYLLVFQFNFICNICFNFIVKLNPNNQIKLAWGKVNFIEINSKPCYRTYLNISQI